MAELRRERAPGARGPTGNRRPGTSAVGGGTGQRRQRRVVQLGQVAEVVEGTGPNQINRRNMTARWPSTPMPLAARPARCRPTSAASSTPSPSPGLPLRIRRLDQEHAGVLRLRRVGPGAGGDLHLHDSGQPVPELPAAAGPHDLAAADADRRGADPAVLRLLHEHVLGHRHRSADGPGDQKRHPAGRLRHPGPRGTGGVPPQPGPEAPC
jgi:hypothetical protein